MKWLEMLVREQGHTGSSDGFVGSEPERIQRIDRPETYVEGPFKTHESPSDGFVGSEPEHVPEDDGPDVDDLYAEELNLRERFEHGVCYRPHVPTATKHRRRTFYAELRRAGVPRDEAGRKALEAIEGTVR